MLPSLKGQYKQMGKKMTWLDEKGNWNLNHHTCRSQPEEPACSTATDHHTYEYQWGYNIIYLSNEVSRYWIKQQKQIKGILKVNLGKLKMKRMKILISISIRPVYFKEALWILVNEKTVNSKIYIQTLFILYYHIHPRMLFEN